MEIDSENLRDLLQLHQAIDEADERPGCLDTDPELFFADEPGMVYREARQLCNACPVKAECAAYAVKWEFDGFFGGLTPRERHALRPRSNRGRKKAA